MAVDREWQVRLQFLDEAGDYLREIEHCLLGCSEQGLARETIDVTLRAAHSIKGGAAMMGFNTLSDLAHRLEDALKVMQTGRITADPSLEQLFLDALTKMQQVSLLHQQQQPIDETWLGTEIEPSFTELYNRLGAPSENDHAAALSAESGVDMRVIMFETEVDACLERLEKVLADPASPVLREEFLLTSQEFGCLGEMLDLPPFVALCNQITTIIEENLVPLATIAPIAFQAWRKSQALVMVGQWAALPERLPIEVSEFIPESNQLLELSNVSDANSDIIAQNQYQPTEELDLLTEETDLADYDSEPYLEDLDAYLVSSLSTDLNSDLNSNLEPSLDVNTAPELVVFDDKSLDIDLDITEDILDITELTESRQPIEHIKSHTVTTIFSEDLSNQSKINQSQSSKTPIDKPVDKASVDDDVTEVVSSTPLTTVPEVTLRVPLRYLEQLSELFGDINAERNSLNIQLKSLQNLVTLLRNRVIGLEVSNQQLRNAYDLVVGANSQPLGITSSNPNVRINQGVSNSKLEEILSMSVVDSGSEDSAITAIISNDNGITANFDALEMDRYNSLHLLTRDIMDSVVQLQEVSNDMDTTLNEAESSARELGRVARQMQTNLERLRMRRLDEILSNFPRVLRELSLRYGKSVQLVVRGGSTLVERSVLEQLNDPLLHLLRNAFDHGIETTAERIAAGKNPKGTIEIIAAYRGNQTTITIRDDGAGINLPKIRQKAKLMGLSDQEIDQAGEGALLDLIFSPGFTTAETVTTLSGRGVGMDVVRTNLRRIGGDVTVKTNTGEGTIFTLFVPVSLAIAQVLLVESNGFMMAVSVTAVEEMLLLEQYPISESESGKTLQWLEQDIPFINLADQFQFNRTQRFVSEENIPKVDRPIALLVRRGTELFALGCDKYWTEVEATMRSVQGSLTLPQGFSGCAVVGGGRLVPLMDIEDILNWLLAEKNTPEITHKLSYPDFSETETAQYMPTILTIDDSINVRRFLALMLEKAGYRVEQAKDGQEALDKLQQGLVVDAAICDIEMPRLDGFGFLAQARSQPTWMELPIVMLTSRSGNKHRDLAMNLGASGYFTKPFKETDLLETIAHLVRQNRHKASETTLKLEKVGSR